MKSKFLLIELRVLLTISLFASLLAYAMGLSASTYSLSGSDSACPDFTNPTNHTSNLFLTTAKSPNAPVEEIRSEQVEEEQEVTEHAQSVAQSSESPYFRPRKGARAQLGAFTIPAYYPIRC